MTGGEGKSLTEVQQLGQALRVLQKRSGRTLRSLESEVMISDSSLSRYLRGSTVPPWATVRDLCRALGGDPADFRLLWEAADRCQPKPPAGDGRGGEPEARAESRWGRWRRTARTRVRSHWMWAAAGTLAGLLLGAGMVLALRPAGAPAQGSSGVEATGGAAARSGPGTGPRTRPGPQDVVRIFVNRATGSCLDHSLDQGLRSYAPNGMSYQRWTVHPSPDGTSELRNHATGACLDSGEGLRALACTHSGAQKWSVTAQPDDSVEVKSRSTGECLDDSSAGLRARPCDGSPHQKWG